MVLYSPCNETFRGHWFDDVEPIATGIVVYLTLETSPELSPSHSYMIIW